MAMSETVHDTTPDDGIRVRGVSAAEDILFADDPSDMVNVCRPSTSGGTSALRRRMDNLDQCMCQPTPTELREFDKRWMILTDEERVTALRCDAPQFLHTVADLVPCLGCRGGTETLFEKTMSGQIAPPTLATNAGLKFDTTKKQFTFGSGRLLSSNATLNLFMHHERWGNLMLTKYNRTTKASTRVRCPLHSQRARGRPRPAAFEALWNKLPDDMQRNLSYIDSELFLTDLENYLRRHRFCCRCKEKVLEAYDLLIGSSCSEDDCEDCAGFDCTDKHHDRGDYGDELHYTSYLFDELTYSRTTGLIGVPCHIDFMSQLMTRADQEIVGDWGDRHARTIAEAQDEVLTCLGIVIWEKMQNLWTKAKTEKRAEELLVHCAVSTIRRNFDVAVEALHGKEMMEQLLAEEDDESRRLAEKKQKKKEKKKKRKTATKQKQAASEQAAAAAKSKNKKKQAPVSSSSSKVTLSVSEVGSSASSSLDGENDDENQSDAESDEQDNSEEPNGVHQCSASCDDVCLLAQAVLDEKREMQLLSAMGWSGSDQFSLSFPESNDDSDDENVGIPEDEIEFWNRNRSALASKRLAQRQKLQEKFDLFVLRANSITES